MYESLDEPDNRMGEIGKKKHLKYVTRLAGPTDLRTSAKIIRLLELYFSFRSPANKALIPQVLRREVMISLLSDI